jgi:hypothetical protein
VPGKMNQSEDDGSPIVDRYQSGEYLDNHPDWHLEDAPGKALDILPSLLAAVDRLGQSTVRLADVGAGVGGVIHETVKQLALARPELEVQAVGFEIAEPAVRRGSELFPDVRLRNKFFDRDDGPFDIVTFNDVLEHLENPWDMLRVAASTSRFMVVRQPLIDNFSTFRLRSYRIQREHWGHIAYFSVDSFLDMAEATGWTPIEERLVPRWELHATNASKGLLASLLTRLDRRWASFFTSGYYLLAAFERRANAE